MIRKPIARFVQRIRGRPVWAADCPAHGPLIIDESYDVDEDQDPEDEDGGVGGGALLVGVNEHGYVFRCPDGPHFFVALSPVARR